MTDQREQWIEEQVNRQSKVTSGLAITYSELRQLLRDAMDVADAHPIRQEDGAGHPHKQLGEQFAREALRVTPTDTMRGGMSAFHKWIKAYEPFDKDEWLTSDLREAFLAGRAHTPTPQGGEIQDGEHRPFMASDCKQYCRLCSDRATQDAQQSGIPGPKGFQHIPWPCKYASAKPLAVPRTVRRSEVDPIEAEADREMGLQEGGNWGNK